jgi:hypothetical protein
MVLLKAVLFMRIAANGPANCHSELFAVMALLSAAHVWLVVSCRSSKVPSTSVENVPEELPVIENAVRAPERQSRLIPREVPTLLNVTEIGFAIVRYLLLSH